MVAATVAAMVAVLAVAAVGPMLARRLPPQWAVWLLSAALIGAAASGAFVLAVLTFLWLGQLSAVAGRGNWSASALQATDPIAHEVSIGSGLLLLPATAWTLRTLVRHVRQLRAWRRIERDCPTRDDAVSVLDTDDIDAFTAPSGRVFLTEGLLAAVTPAERDIVLAHERSHRRHHHVWWRMAVDLAAAVNPLLGPTARAVAHMTERWADEDATRVADRRAVAVTIGRVALLRTHGARAGAAATGGAVPQRVRALLGPPPRTRPTYLLAVLLLLAALAATTVAVEQTCETLFENAMHSQSDTTVTAPGHGAPVN
jgi:Zn-dependent protease with chaperone function